MAVSRWARVYDPALTLTAGLLVATRSLARETFGQLLWLGRRPATSPSFYRKLRRTILLDAVRGKASTTCNSRIRN